MKPEDVRKMKTEELDIAARDLRARSFELRAQAVTEKLEDPSEMGKIRRDVARVLTEKRAREIQAAGETGGN